MNNQRKIYRRPNSLSYSAENFSFGRRYLDGHQQEGSSAPFDSHHTRKTLTDQQLLNASEVKQRQRILTQLEKNDLNIGNTRKLGQTGASSLCQLKEYACEESTDDEQACFRERVWSFLHNGDDPVSRFNKRDDMQLSPRQFAQLSSQAPSPAQIPINPFQEDIGLLRAAVKQSFLESTGSLSTTSIPKATPNQSQSSVECPLLIPPPARKVIYKRPPDIRPPTLPPKLTPQRQISYGIAPLTRDVITLVVRGDRDTISSLQPFKLRIRHDDTTTHNGQRSNSSMTAYEKDQVIQVMLSQMARNPELQKFGSSKWKSSFSKNHIIESPSADKKKFGKISYSSVRQPRALIDVEENTAATGESAAPAAASDSYDNNYYNNINRTTELNKGEQDSILLPAPIASITEGIKNLTHKEFRVFLMAVRNGNKPPLNIKSLSRMKIALGLELLYSFMIQLCDLDWDIPIYPPPQYSALKHLGVYRIECLNRLLSWTIGLPITNNNNNNKINYNNNNNNNLMSPKKTIIILKNLTEFLNNLQYLEFDSIQVPPIAISLYTVYALSSIDKGERFIGRLLLILPWHLSFLLSALITVSRDFRHPRKTDNILTTIFGALVGSQDKSECPLCEFFGVGDIINNNENFKKSISLDDDHYTHAKILPKLISQILEIIRSMQP